MPADWSIITFRVGFASGEEEFITGEGPNDLVAMKDALDKATRFDRKTGRLDPITLIEFWERRS